MKAQFEAQKIQLEAQVKSQLLQVEYQLKMQLAQVEAQARGGMTMQQTMSKENLDMMKEDRKDERVRKQAVEQSKLIAQRKGERPELSDETTADPLDALL